MATITINTDGLKTALAEVLEDICRSIAIQSAKEQSQKARKIIELYPTREEASYSVFSNTRLLIYKLLNLDESRLLSMKMIRGGSHYYYNPCDFTGTAKYEINGIVYKCVDMSRGRIRLEEELPNER
jgi:hypothetical protein